LKKADEHRKVIMKYLRKRYKELGRNFHIKPRWISKETGLSNHQIGQTLGHCIRKGDPVIVWGTNGKSGTTYQTTF